MTKFVTVLRPRVSTINDIPPRPPLCSLVKIFMRDPLVMGEMGHMGHGSCSVGHMGRGSPDCSISCSDVRYAHTWAPITWKLYTVCRTAALLVTSNDP